MNKEQVKQLKEIRRELTYDQKTLVNAGEAKNHIIQTKISFLDSVLEWHYERTRVKHKGVYAGEYVEFSKVNDNAATVTQIYHAIEVTQTNKDVRSFVNRVRKLAFDNWVEWWAFKMAVQVDRSNDDTVITSAIVSELAKLSNVDKIAVLRYIKNTYNNTIGDDNESVW